MMHIVRWDPSDNRMVSIPPTDLPAGALLLVRIVSSERLPVTPMDSVSVRASTSTGADKVHSVGVNFCTCNYIS